jgi:hypothetical protein
MDMMATRVWGLTLSAALLAGAIVVAATAPERAAGHAEASAASPALQAAPSPAPVATSLVVRFRGRGPLARAARMRQAHRVVQQLGRQRALRGLCFSRFEGAGLVLHACGSAALGEWPRRLRAMRSVASVDLGE